MSDSRPPTPRPWGWCPELGNFILASAEIVAEIPCTGGNPSDGELIVRAVNSYDAMLADIAEYRDRLRELSLGHDAFGTSEDCGKRADELEKQFNLPRKS